MGVWLNSVTVGATTPVNVYQDAFRHRAGMRNSLEFGARATCESSDQRFVAVRAPANAGKDA